MKNPSEEFLRGFSFEYCNNYFLLAAFLFVVFFFAAFLRVAFFFVAFFFAAI